MTAKIKNLLEELEGKVKGISQSIEARGESEREREMGARKLSKKLSKHISQNKRISWVLRLKGHTNCLMQWMKTPHRDSHWWHLRTIKIEKKHATLLTGLPLKSSPAASGPWGYPTSPCIFLVPSLPHSTWPLFYIISSQSSTNVPSTLSQLTNKRELCHPPTISITSAPGCSTFSDTTVCSYS